jgi:hypothetical protein
MEGITNSRYNTYVHEDVILKLYIDILNKQKCLFSKTEDKKEKQVLSRRWYKWEGEDIRKECRRVNMMEILCTHV